MKGERCCIVPGPLAHTCPTCTGQTCWRHAYISERGLVLCPFCATVLEEATPPPVPVSLGATKISAAIVVHAFHACGASRTALQILDLCRESAVDAAAVALRGGGHWTDRFDSLAKRLVMSFDGALAWEALGDPTLVSAHHTPAIEWALRYAPGDSRLVLHFHTEARLCPEACALLGKAAERNARVVFPSARSLEQYAAVASDQAWFRESAVVVPTLITRELGAMSPRDSSRRLPPPTGGPRVGVVARVDDDKTDLEYLMATIRALGERDSTAQVVIAGFGERLPQLREAVDELVGPLQPTILGHVEDIESVYVWSEVLFLPSYTEVFPHSVLEGAVRGLYSVVADFGFGSHGCEAWLIQSPVGDAERAALELLKAARRHREKEFAALDGGDVAETHRARLRSLIFSNLRGGLITP